MAIAIEATGGLVVGTTGATTASTSCTPAGVDRVGIAITIERATNTVTGCTWDGAAMTEIMSFTPSVGSTATNFRWWAIVNPPASAATVTVTRSGTTSYLTIGAIALSGAAQAIPTLFDNDASASVTSEENSITTTVDGSAVLGFGRMDNGNIAASTGATFIGIAVDGDGTSGDQMSMMRSTTFPTAVAGSVSLTITGATDSNGQLLLLAVEPAGDVAQNSNFFLVM